MTFGIKKLVSVCVAAFISMILSGCSQRAAENDPAAPESQASQAPAVPAVNQIELKAKQRDLLLDQIASGVACSGSMNYVKQRQYATEGFMGYGGMTRHFSSAWDVFVLLSNSCAFEINLGDTLMVLEESTEGDAYIAGSLQRDGALETNHIWRYEERYALDSYTAIRRSGACREQPTVAGASFGFVASETGEPMEGEFAMALRKVDPWPSYAGYGYGVLPPASTLIISNAVLMGNGFKPSFLRAVYVAAPSLHVEQGGDHVIGRFILRFEPDASAMPATGTVTVASGVQAEERLPMKFVSAEFVPVRGSDLLAMAADGRRGLIERALALNWLGELGEPLYEEQFKAWINDRILPVLLRRASVWHLSRLGTGTARAAILQTLEDPNAPYALRVSCAFALAEINDVAASDALLNLLRSPQTPPMPGFYNAARLLGDKRFGAPLATLLTLQSHTSVVSSIAYALSTTVDSNAVAPLVDAARSGNSDICTKALYYLGQSRCAESAKALKELASSPGFTNRGGAVSALGACDTPESQAALIELLGDPARTGLYHGIITALRPPQGRSSDSLLLFGKEREKITNSNLVATWDHAPATDALVDFSSRDGGARLAEVLKTLAALPPTPKGRAFVGNILGTNNVPDSAVSAACDVAKAWRMQEAKASLESLIRQGSSNVVASATLAMTELVGVPDETLYRKAMGSCNRVSFDNGFKLLVNDLVKRRPAWAAALLAEQLDQKDSLAATLEGLAKLGEQASAAKESVRRVAETPDFAMNKNQAIQTLCALHDSNTAWFAGMLTNRDLSAEAKGACLLVLARSVPEQARPLLLNQITNGFEGATPLTIEAVSLVADDTLCDAILARIPKADETEVAKLAEALAGKQNPIVRTALQKEFLVAEYGKATRERIRKVLAGENLISE